MLLRCISGHFHQFLACFITFCSPLLLSCLSLFSLALTTLPTLSHPLHFWKSHEAQKASKLPPRPLCLYRSALTTHNASLYRGDEMDSPFLGKANGSDKEWKHLRIFTTN